MVKKENFFEIVKVYRFLNLHAIKVNRRFKFGWQPGFKNLTKDGGVPNPLSGIKTVSKFALFL